jgi:hypothetical protein
MQAVNDAKYPGKKDILILLQTYHTDLLQGNTLPSQSPRNVTAVRSLLRSKSNSIQRFLAGDPSVAEEVESDTRLNTLLTQLNALLQQGDNELPVLAKYWCQLMFVEFPFVIASEHIDRLVEATNYTDEVDGTELDVEEAEAESEAVPRMS